MRVILGAVFKAIWGATWLGLSACAPDLDTTRTADTHSFGERVVTLMCKRIAFQAEPSDVRGDHFRDACSGGAVPGDAPPALAALLDRRPQLVTAIDTAVPAAFTADLQAFLVDDRTLALYDDDTMSRSIASIADLLDEVAHDDAALTALARAGVRDGYRPAAAAFGVPAALTNARARAASASPVAPSLRDVLGKTVPALTSGGAAHAEWDALIAAVSATLLDAEAPSDAASPDRTAALAAGFLLSERADVVEPATAPLVQRDARGIARVALVGGAVPAPFVDADRDNLADVDALGRFVDARARRSPRPLRSRSPATPRRATRRAGRRPTATSPSIAR